jgi:hypothetical protein
VRAHRKPEKQAAEMTRMKPRAENSISPKTIITTPAVMVAIMATRRQDGFSRRKRKAKMRTKASEDDLHIAERMLVKMEGKGGGHTIKRQSNKFQTHIPQPDIQPSSHSTGSNSRKIEHPCHKWFLGFCLMLLHVLIGMCVLRIRKGVVSRSKTRKEV